MIRPKKLEANDRVGIIATARKVSREELKPCVDLLKSWGFKVVFAPNLFAEDNQFAGTDIQRADDLQWAIDHPELKAVIVARGGYGTSRIIDMVDFSILKSYPKWFIGFSDVTVLLNQLFNEGFQALHAPIALLLAKQGHKESADFVKDLLSEDITYDFSAPFHVLNTVGAVSGEVIGGNLSILHTILATSSDVDYDGKILFIEDLDEYLYHIDRMMVHLDRAGKLSGLAGIVIGHMSDMNDNAIPFGRSAYEIIHDYCGKYGYPMGFSFPIGHEAANHPVIVGETYLLDVKSTGSSLKVKL